MQTNKLKQLKIAKVGVEYECAIQNVGAIIPSFPHFSRTQDASIDTKRGYEVEYVSEPMPLAKMDELESALRSIEAKTAEINKSMGFHIHVSFQDEDSYTRFFSKRFFDYFSAKIAEFVAKHPGEGMLKRRLSNHYCAARLEDGVRQLMRQYEAQDKNGVRYAAVNFAHGMHQTIEFRIFPSRRRNTFRYVRLLLSIMLQYAAEFPNKQEWAEVAEEEGEEEMVIEVTE